MHRSWMGEGPGVKVGKATCPGWGSAEGGGERRIRACRDGF